MAMIELKQNPTARELAVFSRGVPIVFGILGVLRWRAGSTEAAWALMSVGLVVSLVLLFAPPARRPLYIGWMYVTYPIAWTFSHVALAVVYFLVASPLALLLRLLGRDPMSRRFDKKASSYWVARRPAKDMSRYFRQF